MKNSIMYKSQAYVLAAMAIIVLLFAGSSNAQKSPIGNCYPARIVGIDAQFCICGHELESVIGLILTDEDQIPKKFYGELDGDSLLVKRILLFDLEQNRDVPAAWLTRGLKLDSVPLRIQRSETGFSDDKIEQLLSQRNQAIESAVKIYPQYKASVQSLNDKGHAIFIYEYPLRNGKIQTLAFPCQMTNDESDGYRNLESDEYETLKLFQKLPYIHRMRLDSSKVDPARFADSLGPLQAIGKLNLEPWSEPMAFVADFNSVQEITAIGRANIWPTLPNIEGLERLYLTCDPNLGISEADAMRACKSLKHLSIGYRSRKKNDDIVYQLRGLNIESLKLGSSTLSKQSVENIKSILGLKRLYIHEIGKNSNIKLIQNETIEELEIGFAWGLDDSHLVGWELPENLKTLKLNYWTPEPAANYVRRLPKMQAKERAVYNAVRQFPAFVNKYRTYRDNSHLLFMSNVFLKGTLRDEYKYLVNLANKFDFEQNQNVEDPRIELLPAIASAVNEEVEKMWLSNELILNNVIAVQAITYKYGGGWIEPIKKYLKVGQVEAIEISRRELLKRIELDKHR